jgi:hypothetical protein
MPTPTRALTNNYQDCKLVKLDAADPTSPLVVMQEGYSPSDPTCRMRMFYLQRDGLWIDEVARSTRPEDEVGDIVFDTPADAIRTISGLFGKPLIREIPVTDADVQNYMTTARSGSSEELFRRFLSRYRNSKARSNSR